MMYKETPHTEIIEVGEDCLEAPEDFRYTGPEELESYAQDYGFKDWEEMRDYFKTLSPLPWKGTVKYYVAFEEK